MNKQSSTFLKQIAQITPNMVVTSSWLKQKGISNRLQYMYKQNGWLKSIGQGAFVKFDVEQPHFEGAVFALQQEGVKVHIGGQSALALSGKEQYARVINTWRLFSGRHVFLPRWFQNFKFHDNWRHYKTTFLPENLGLTKRTIDGLEIEVSSLERAILELLYQTSIDFSIQEAYDIYEFLMTLRPDLLQELLENCDSIKVKRLFLFWGEQFNYSWFKYLKPEKIDLGNGVREISKGGKYDKKYKIIVKENENE